MKLTFKDLKQTKFTIDAEPSETIGQLKEKISTEKGWEASTQKLIYSGKILQDENTIESYKIEEKGFIVCMTSKPKAAPSKAAAPATPSKPASTPAAPAAPAHSSGATASQPPATPSPVPASTAATTPAGAGLHSSSAMAFGEQGSAVFAQMEAMGFQREEIERAMRAAFHNPDRAVEYLLNGIPESAQQEQRQAPAQARGGANPAAQLPTGTAAARTPSAPAAGGEEPVNLFDQAAAQNEPGQGQPGTQDLDFLRSNPQFAQLRQAVQQQPMMLEPILQQVAAGNPRLAQIIAEHPQQFMQLLTENVDDEEIDAPPGLQQVVVTEEEREAIERLCRLGFDRDMAIQAYFACDKNEELAANFLFEQPDDPEA